MNYGNPSTLMPEFPCGGCAASLHDDDERCYVDPQGRYGSAGAWYCACCWLALYERWVGRPAPTARRMIDPGAED